MCGGAGRAGTSQFMGVSWNHTKSKWKAKCKGKYLGYHTTEEAAARAYSKSLQDGVFPEPAGSSQLKGVSWNKGRNQWEAVCKGTYLGCHSTEEDAARACSKYLKDGIDPVKHRAASTSRFKGVHWVKARNKWSAKCKGSYLGLHATEKAAVRAYNVEAERVGRPLNVIPPAGAAGAGAGAGAGTGAGRRRRWHQAPSTSDTGDTDVDQEDRARCSDDIGDSCD